MLIALAAVVSNLLVFSLYMKKLSFFFFFMFGFIGSKTSVLWQLPGGVGMFSAFTVELKTK